VADASHTETETEEMSLDDKVQAAMKRLGIDPPSAQDDHDADNNDIVESESATATATAVPSNVECKDGVCEIKEEQEEENVMDLGNRIAKEMNVDVSLAMAALGATHSSDATSPEYNESAARALIQQELDAMKSISEDCDEVRPTNSRTHGS
jgi:3-phosphoglycerate kinase